MSSTFCVALLAVLPSMPQTSDAILEWFARDAAFLAEGYFVLVGEELLDRGCPEFGMFEKEIQYTWGASGEYAIASGYNFDEPGWIDPAVRKTDYRDVFTDSLIISREITSFSERTPTVNRLRTEHQAVVVSEESVEVLPTHAIQYNTYSAESQSPLWYAKQAVYATGRGYSSLISSIDSIQVDEGGVKVVCRGKLWSGEVGLGYWVITISPAQNYVVTEAEFFREFGYAIDQPVLTLTSSGLAHSSGLLAHSTVTLHLGGGASLERHYVLVASSNGEASDVRELVQAMWAPSDDLDRDMINFTVDPPHVEYSRGGALEYDSLNP